MVKNISKVLAIAQRACELAGARLTKKRRNVLEILLADETPRSAYEIADQYRERYGNCLPVMSAYRMLGFLQKEKLVHKLVTTNQYIACAHIACNHAHAVPQFLICDSCHSVREIGIQQAITAELKNNIASAGFVMSSQQLEFHGLCEQCHP